MAKSDDILKKYGITQVRGSEPAPTTTYQKASGTGSTKADDILSKYGITQVRRSESGSVQDWADEVRTLLLEAQRYSSDKWHSKDDEGYKSLQSRIDSHISQGDYWYSQHKEDDAFRSIYSALNSASNTLGNIHSYFSKWDTEDAYNSAVEKAKADAERWTELTGGYDSTKHQAEGQAGWDDYVATQDRIAQNKAQAEEETPWWEKMLGYLGDVGSDTSLPVHTTQTVEQGYRDWERDMQKPNDRWTEEQQYIYGYLWKSNRAKASEYAYAVNNMLNTQREDAQREDVRNWATDNFGAGVAHTAGAILTAPLGMADYLGDVIAQGTLGYVPEADGNITPFEYSQEVTGGITENLNKIGTLNEAIPIIGGKGLGDVYGLGTSIIQSSVAAYTGGSAQALISFFGSAAASGVDDAISRGVTGEQAVLYGTAVGAAESLAEMAGIDNLMKIGSSKTVKALLLNLLKQGAAEGLEEGITSFLSNVADNVIIGEKSNFYIRVQAYMSAGMSEEEAKKKAWTELWEDMAFDMLGGFVSGAVHAGPQTAYHTYASIATPGKSIMNADGGVDALKNLANQVAGVSDDKMKKSLTKQAGKVSSDVATGSGIGKVGAAIKNANNAVKVGKLYNTVQTANNLANASANQADIAKSLQRKGFNAETANDIASALVAQYNGQELTKAQAKLLKSVENSESVKKAISGIMANEQSTMGQRSQNIRSFQNEVSRGVVTKAITEAIRKNTTEKQFTPAGEYEVSDSGKAINTESGEDIDIKGVSAISNGKMALELADGTTIDAKSVSFASESDALIYEAVANLGDNISAETANKLISKFDGKNAAVFARGIAQAYTYGFYGIDRSEMTGEHSVATELTKEQRNYAYGLGEQYRSVKDTADKAKARAKKAPGEKGVFYRDKNGNATDIRSYLKKDGRVLNEMQTTGIEFMEKMSKMMGVRFNVFEGWEENGTRYYLDENGEKTEGSPNGFYDPKTGEIYIDLFAGNDFQGTMLFTVAHELTHFMRQWSPEHFTKIAKVVFSHAGFKGSVSSLVADKMNSKRRPNYDTALEEVVADAMETILKDGKVAEFMADVKKTDSKVWAKLKEWFKNFAEFLKKMVDAYSGQSAQTVEGQKVADFSKKLLNQIEQIWAEGAVSAGENYQTAQIGGEVDVDGDANKHLLSDRSIIEGAGLQFIPDEDGTHYKVLDAQGNEVKEVTTEMIADSPLGDLVTIAMENGFLGKGKTAIQAATKQYAFLADLVNMCIRYDGIAPIWETAGTMVFSSIKSNADKQYGLTIDFSTVCKKTQAIVDAMSEAMVRLGRGLTRSEVETIYLEVGKAGESTPCPVCYVFSRWMGIGGILDQINRFQEKYHGMSEAKIQSFISDVQERIKVRANTPNAAGKLKSDFFDKNGGIKEGKVISDLKAKANARAASALNAIAKNSDIQLQIQELEVLMENQDAKEAKKTAKKIEKLKAKLVDASQLESQFKQYNDEVEEYEAYQWLTRTLMKEENGKWVKNEAFKPVPPEVLFDLNNGATFAEEYPLSWAFRTGKGAAAGKAITPYADARVGEAIQGIASQDVKSIKTGIDLNPFLNGDKKARQDIINRAIVKQARQNLIGGQRYQSTSDFRYEYGSDYLITFLEMQAIGAKVQLYTKVIEAVDFLASMGADVNLSVMPLSNGFVTLPNGQKKLIYSSVTGIDKDAALSKVHEYDNVQLILVGISDEHIRLALEGEDVTFVIPFHGSGNTVHQIQVLMNLLGENLDVTTAQDYTAVQSDHISPKQTKEQKDLWNLRVKIITGKASTLSTGEQALLEKNAFIKDLYRRFYVDKSAEEYGISLGKDQAEQIFPYEYWDKTLAYAEADKNGERFKEYCASMGIIPRFSGMNSKGESVGYGDFTADKGYWKLLIDRRMYDNTYDSNGNWTGYGKYHVQKRINCSDFQVKHLDPEYGSATYGDVMSKANDPKKTSAIVDRAIAQFENKGTMFSERVTDKKTLDFLNEQLRNGEVTEVYRAMAVDDAQNLYPPMAGFVKVDGKKVINGQPSVIGAWEKSTESIKWESVDEAFLIANGFKYYPKPNKDYPNGRYEKDNDIFYRNKDGEWKAKFHLFKDNGEKVDAAYAPYIHTSLSVLNDQFTSAYKRENLVVVRGYVPNSEIYGENGKIYHAKFADKPVGKTKWHSGVVAAQMPETRTVILSRYFMPIEIVDDAVFAQKTKDMMQGKDIEIPYNVVTPRQRRALEAIGVRIGEARGLKDAPKKADVKYSEREASDFVATLKGKVKDTGGWYAKDVFKYVEEHPSLNFIERIFEKDKAVKKDLENFLNDINDTDVLDNLSWFMGEAYGDKGRTWTWDGGTSYPYRGAVRTFRNAVKKRISVVMAEKVGGTNLGIKNGVVELEYIKGLYSQLNSNDEMKEFAEKVFATAEKLGVNIRFINQTLSKQPVKGDNLGDMVEYKTSYFNDTAVIDQHKANTILHELIHACTVYVMDSNKFMGDVSWSNKSENYNRIANAAQRLNRIYNEIQYDPDFKGQYGLKNAKEMVAELANPEFVGLMKKKNLWDSIVDWICDLFGIRRGSSAYDNARMCLDYILDNPEVSEYKDYAQKMRMAAYRANMNTFGRTLYSDRNNAPTFYSQMAKVVDAVKQEKLGAASVVSMLRGKGVKAEEIKWSGIEEWLAGKKSVTKAELQEFIAGSMLQIVEQGTDGRIKYTTEQKARRDELSVAHGDLWDSVDQYWLGLYGDWLPFDVFSAEGGTDIIRNKVRESGDVASESGKKLLKLADDIDQIDQDIADLEAEAKKQNKLTRWKEYSLDGGENYREILFKMPGSSYTNNAMRVHWGADAMGILAHARVQDFDVNGNKMLFIEEIQSDWHNEGHSKGYETAEYKEAERVSDELFNEWQKVRKPYHQYVRSSEFNTDPEDVRKKKYDWLRSKVEAAEKKWQEAERYVESLREKGAGTVPDAPFKDTYHEFVLKRLLRMAAEEGYDSIGWTTADTQSERWSDEFAEGYRIEYDQDIPKFLRKYGKKWGAEVGKTTLGNSLGEEDYTDNEGNAYSSIREWYDSVMDSYADKDPDVWNAYIAGQTKVIQVDNTMHIQMKQTGEILEEALHITQDPVQVWSMDITPAMKESVMTEGQPLYSDRVLMGSLFSGGGTLEAGLVYQMLDKEFAVEYNKQIAATYTDNHGKEHMFVGDVRDFNSKDKQNVFYLHASPVCKNFSPASHGGGEKTLDIVTAQATARVLEEQMPQVFTVENVKRYIGSEAYKIITDKLTELGYKWDVDVYKASDYGNATKRERMIIRAVKDGDLPAKPAKVSGITSWGEATRDLWETDLIPSTLVKSKIEAIRNTPALKNLKLTKLDKPLMIYDTTKSKQITYAWADELAPTLTTKCGDARIIMPDGKVYEPTPKFMGRIQGLPDGYKYPKAKTNAFKIIGNGIPTQLTKAVVGGVLDSAYEQTHDGAVLYQDRAEDSVSNRSLLANAFEGIAKPEELQKIQEYKDKVALINAEEKKLRELNEQIKALSFAKGQRDNKRIKALRFDAVQAANRINTYDKQLLRLEASKPLQDVLNREKKLAYKKAEQRGKEALADYKAKVEAQQKKTTEKWRESRKSAVAKARETAEKRDARAKLQKLVLDTVKWISYPAKTDVKCPDILKKPYEAFLQGIDLSSKRLANGGEATNNDLRLANAMDSLATAIDRVMLSQDPSQEVDKVLDIGYLDLPADFVQKLRDMTESIKSMMVEGEYVVNTMTAEEVRKLSQMIRTLNHAIKTMSKLYANLRFANVEALGFDTMDFLDAVGEIEKTGGMKDFAQWDNALPYYAFKRFGNGGESIFEGLMDAQDKLAFLAQDIFDFQEKTWTGKEAKDWSEDTHTITLPNGTELTLTTADAMSIYCLSRREQALPHLLGGGIRVMGIQEGSQKAKDSRSLLTIKDVDAIISSLTDRQKQVAEGIQEFMSTVCSEWGNEISMKRFLTREFTEKFYFPIESNDENLTVKDPAAQQSDLFRLLNISATKPLTQGANNEVIIRNIFDVFTGHASDMARLNAYGMGLLDYMKWLNYREKTTNEEGQIDVKGVRKSMEKAYGKAANSYVLNLIKDVNGRASDGGDPTILMKWMRAAKTASVGSSLRVATLQITSYPRAALVLSPKSLALGLSKMPNINRAKKYCGVALWKSFGFYDTNISRSIEEQMKGVKDVKQKLIELSLKGAEWGDAITWGALWNACEYEVAKTTTNKVGSEEFYQEVGKKLREVVYRTQVVDSTLTRSQIMRSKRGMAQEAAAFMSEPTLSANILMDAGFEFGLEKRRTGSAKKAWKKTGSYIGRAVAVYSIGQLTAALMEALWDAWRDDDDEEFDEKYLSAFVENLVLDLVPFNKLPIVSDVFEAALSMFGVGFYSSDKMSTTWLTQAVSAVDTWKKVFSGESSTTVYNALYKSTRALSSFFGVSVSGVMREGVALWNNTAGAYDSTLKLRQYDLSKADLGVELYEAIISGNIRQADSLKAQFADADAMHSAVRKALRENDPRIKEAALAQINGDPSERVRIAKLIIADGFDQDDVVTTINSVISNMKPDTPKSDPKKKGYYTAEDFALEISNGDQASAYAVKADIIATAQKNGKTEEDAMKSFVSSAKSALKDMVLSGEVSENSATNALVTFCDMSEDDALADVQYWVFKRNYPDVFAEDSWFDKYYEDVADSGISIDMYMEYRNQVKGITGENKKAGRMAVIHSLPITSAQKDALYFAEGWAASKLYEAPWH